MKHASFFSGVGGLDLGFERAGIHTVSVSEIDAYACAVLAERFPDAPNLGSITEVEANDIPEADIWSGGFPCQDLSVAGKRAGFAGKRSSLAFTFLDLVEQRRPRWIVLENVPGLFSSNNGADFGRLLYEMEQLGYGVSWRTLDARYFGVAQRRRRVFIVGSLESDRAAEVLLECEGCERHPSPRWTQRQGVAGGAPDGSGVAGAITRRFSKGVNSTIDEPLIVSPSPDSDRVRAADGLARRLDNQQGVARKSSFGHYEMTEQAGTLKSSGGDIGGGSENLAMTLTSPQGGGRRDKIPMTLVQAVIQDSREIEHKGQNGFGLSTDDISYTLTSVDRQAVATESTVPERSFFRKVGPGSYRESEGLAGPNLASGGDVGGGSENIITFSAHLTDASASIREHNPSLLTQGDAAVCYGSASAPAVFRKAARTQTSEDSETWVEGDVSNTLNSFDVGDVRTTHAIVSAAAFKAGNSAAARSIGYEEEISPSLEAGGGGNNKPTVLIGSSDSAIALAGVDDDSLLPIGLDSHRYRCCGNGVVAPVAEWIGRRIVEVDRRWREEGK